MRVVYKYKLIIGGISPIQLPIGCNIVHFDFQGDTPHLWAEITLNNPTQTRVFQIYGTGMHIDDKAHYISTRIMDGYVWHLYEITE